MRPILAVAVALLAGSAVAIPPPLPIHLNQIGFTPGDTKTAIVWGGSAPLEWVLVDAGGREVKRGKARVFGPDAASGAEVQRIDFSDVRLPGEGYRLVVGGSRSDPFAIRDGIYASLAKDALAFFYHQRAGVPIDARLVGAAWARPAGHPREVAKCFAGRDERGSEWPGCGYALDVTGGWYDAGDHGKYVVNGGISLWTLLNAHERRPAAFGDGSLKLPAAGNRVGDLLDEARFEMDFLLRMQIADEVRARVPAGAPKPAKAGKPAWETEPADFADIDAGGMAHQKVADRNWTGLPMPPQDDPEERLLYPPTTAATLNLAATAAQCARIWREVDQAFAARCRAAAERAWRAAKRNPQIYATNSFTGSGGYGDGDVSDEFYWAAAELFATTGAAEYRDAVLQSPHFHTELREPGWPSTATLGTITLATARNGLPKAEVDRLRSAIVAAADRFLADEKDNGYGIPYVASGYPWGSNSSLLNRAMLLGLAHDFTGVAKYRAGVVAAMDYVLGRNPLGQSYVSGYGARPLMHPHHRFWAPSLDPKLPGPPPGVLSGGPNSTAMSDDVAKKMRGCAPQRCWVDDIHAYSMNEVAINWNAPLFWVAAWLDS
ncbi:glycoside hydrolase family 9 protein [Sphingomonas sp. DG1-23]|uniref:glycoside hydrolase family 9 protein n=1 Tax=Sphingomonas sp. DG1-23 TaxID=3068316 RepID=UPI0027402D67|nr:glycoside hydrolase family 9 protein [Sphingomonas sp. DG1-23]MDP5280314.1 glycoside hydrolase family 9 protein [Sphingomonas sp. DG1-23]